MVRADQDKGPLAGLNGSSDWRPFWLPIDISQLKDPGQVNSIALRVATPSQSSNDSHIFFRDVKLVQYPGGQFPASLLQGQPLPTPQILHGTTVPIALHVASMTRALFIPLKVGAFPRVPLVLGAGYQQNFCVPFSQP